MKSTLINLTVFLLFISLAKGYTQYGTSTKSDSSLPSSSTSKTISDGNRNSRLDTGSLLNKDKMLSPIQADNKEDDFGLVEVKESEIPEGTEVYVLEEPIDKPTNGEILQTANNIVFRPLFRYREKQEAQRRNYNNRIRRRYFVARRPYRHTYRYPSAYYY